MSRSDCSCSNTCNSWLVSGWQEGQHRLEKYSAVKMPKLFHGNLGHDCRQRDIDKLFDGFGELRNVNIKGQYGFLELNDKRDAEDGIREVNRKSFNGGR